MAYFTKDFTAFFRELEKNNNKEWFDKNKKRFEASVKLPFEVFVSEMIKRMKKIDPSVNMSPKDAIFRIYRDIRFSNDKRPYKNYMSAAISSGGKKDYETPGLYLECRADLVRIYSGVYMAEKDVLYNVRTHIAENGKEFEKLLKDKKFTSVFGTIQGEKGKILPPELKEAAIKQALIFNKQFYYSADFGAGILLDDKLPEKLISAYSACLPMNKFLSKARA